MSWIHTCAWDYPLPLVRPGSVVRWNPLYRGGYTLETYFGPDYGWRVTFFGEETDLIKRLREGGKVAYDADAEVWRIIEARA